MELTGRLTRDAAVKTTKSGKEFIAFSIAQNDTYKAKGSEEITRIVTYIDCAYWRGSNIAPFMTKGTVVELSGRIGVNAWNNKDGVARAQLTCHVSTIKLLGGGGRTAESRAKTQPQSPKGRKVKNAAPQTVTADDDLPF